MTGRGRRYGWLGVAVLILCGCGGTQGVAPVRERAATSRHVSPHQAGPGYHIVRAGDTLYSIAFQYGYSYRDVAAWNGIAAPYVIYRGQRLRVRPPQGAPVSASPAVPPHAPRTESAPAARQRAPGSGTAARSGDDDDTGVVGPVRWIWPTDGHLSRTFAADEPGRRGIDISGGLGQPIRAAGAGKVVYSGSGLVGYGNLIIIKHDKTYLSAYAFNRKLLVHEGDRVRGGQRIAEMGRNGSGAPLLHFEIRRDGKPVDPLPFLPRR